MAKGKLGSQQLTPGKAGTTTLTFNQSLTPSPGDPQSEVDDASLTQKSTTVNIGTEEWTVVGPDGQQPSTG